MDYKVGDFVMVKLNRTEFKTLRKHHKGLLRRYEGPFEIVAKVGKIPYRLKLTLHLKPCKSSQTLS